MTSHELARILLELPDAPVVYLGNGEDYNVTRVEEKTYRGESPIIELYGKALT